MLQVRPTTIKAARRWACRRHRHLAAVTGGLFAVSAYSGEELVGVAIVGIPKAKGFMDGWTAEVARVATDETRNACSFLYGVAKRTCRVLGYRRLITYTLPSEGGRAYGPRAFRR